MLEVPQTCEVPRSTASKHEDRIERLDDVFYIRWTSGPDYEDAFICVEDGEPDMLYVARVSFGKAELFASAYRHAMARKPRPTPEQPMKEGV